MDMLAVHPPDGPPFLGGKPPGNPPRTLQPDSNSNFVARAYDANENWSQGVDGALSQEASPPPPPSDNQAFLGNGPPPAPESALLSPPPEEVVRSPPEGAEGSRARPEKAGPGPSSAGSPLEDIGYSSSSLSIDSSPSPAYEVPGVLTSPVPESPEPDPLLPTLTAAVLHLQARERFKEWEKEKHHVHLVMYRRLALLQWIRGLQQRLVDQQARLQESYDTILDNRKELIRRLQQGTGPPQRSAQDSG
ncbi:UPF0500 protein C1orf216 homolog [Tachyglossus aculeatus]|uniref:UPF0500 protein C1orf216 homolog n=1 Tax=Tachyglossus aculeatus TaxID=9261 RepID=UPI0018F6328D|nr:UPF0500 protein C1orf216 homolog [Tachyglossus aculeatus]